MPEGNSTRVDVLSKLTQVSSRPVGPGKRQPLSPLDHAMGLHSLHVIFYYKSKPFESSDLIPLRNSLCEVLSMYPSITGRFTRDETGNWVINCNDAGTRVYRAKVGTTLDEWLRSADGSQEKDLTAWDGMPEEVSTWSPFQIQINEFEDGGVAIGISCSHMHVDPTSITSFIKSWAETYRGERVPNPPSFQQSALCCPKKPSIHTKSTDYYSTKAEAETPNVKMATRSFRFSCSTMKLCLSQCHAKFPDATPFDFLAALFWTSIIRLKAPLQGHAHSISMCVDFRKLLKPPVLSPDYFGNAIHFSILSASEEDIQHDGLEGVVELVHKHVSGLKEEELWSVIDWFESRKDEDGKLASPFRMYGPELTCVSMEHMIFSDSVHHSLPYAAKFEKDEEPVHVSYHVGNVEGEGLILVMPCAEGGLARTVSVTLPEEEMAKLCQDQAILDLKPITLLSGIWNSNGSSEE